MQVIFFEEPGTTYHKGNTKENSRKFHNSFPSAISHVYVFPSATVVFFFTDDEVVCTLEDAAFFAAFVA